MRAVVQRVNSSHVSVGEEIVGKIGKGLCVLLGIGKTDTEADADYICDKIVGLRIFSDENDKLNLSIGDIGAECLMVSQFTLFGDVRHGRRPSFTAAAGFDEGKGLYEYCLSRLRELGVKVSCGSYGADMQVYIQNNGPVTILLDSSKQF